jgi:hypothetical protein
MANRKLKLKAYSPRPTKAEQVYGNVQEGVQPQGAAQLDGRRETEQGLLAGVQASASSRRLMA